MIHRSLAHSHGTRRRKWGKWILRAGYRFCSAAVGLGRKAQLSIPPASGGAQSQTLARLFCWVGAQEVTAAKREAKKHPLMKIRLQYIFQGVREPRSALPAPKEKLQDAAVTTEITKHWKHFLPFQMQQRFCLHGLYSVIGIVLINK